MRVFIAFVLLCIGIKHVSAEPSQEVIAGIKKSSEEITRLHSSGKYTETLVLVKQVLEKAERELGPDHRETQATINKMAVLYYSMGKYRLAEPLFKRTLQARERLLGIEHHETLQSVNNLAALYLAQGRYGLAEPLFKRTLNERKRLIGEEHPDTLITAGNLAALYRQQGRYDMAIRLDKNTLEIRERVLGKDHPHTLISVNNLAVLYKSDGRSLLAENLFKRAMETRQRVLGKEHPDTILSVFNLANFYDHMVRYDLATPLFKRAREAAVRILGEQHPHTLQYTSSLASSYYKAREWEQALALFEQTTSGFVKNTRLGLNLLSSETKSVAERNSFIFQVYLKTAYRLGEEQTDKQAELSRSSFTRMQWIGGAEASAALSQMAVRFVAGRDRLSGLVRERQDLVREWKKLDEAIGMAAGLSLDKRDTKAEKNNRHNRQTALKRLAEIDRIFATEFPEYSALANPQPLSVEDVQKYLQNDEALIYVVPTPGYLPLLAETFIWVVTRTEQKWVRAKAGPETFRIMVKKLRCGLDQANWENTGIAEECNRMLNTDYSFNDLDSGKPLPFDTHTAHQLYQTLFGQIRDMIKGRKLLLVTSGSLTSLPFQVLLTEMPESATSYNDMKWLINEHDLTVLPSVASLRSLRRTSKPSLAKNPFLGIGNPLLVGSEGKDRRAWERQHCDNKFEKPLRFVRFTLPDRLASFFRSGQVNLKLLKHQSPLPETADELCTVASLLGADSNLVKLGANATETTIKHLSNAGVLKNAKVIHFATHGLIAEEMENILKFRAEPSLMLTPPEQATPEDDGLLTASEITQLKLDADWVILSACNTAAGDKPGAEAMSGLAKAFFYAGARALLVSHWAVNSDATVSLITITLRELAKNPEIGKSGALRMAMQEMIRSKRSHPSIWAPFIVVGEGTHYR